MKKIEKRIYYIVFFCAIAITLFSLDDITKSNDLLIEEVQNYAAKENSDQSSQNITPYNNKESNNTSLGTQEAKDVSNATEKIASPENSDKEEKDQEKKEVEFSSIQSSGLTLANGDSWYFEEYDKNGNIVSTASYNKKKLLSKSQFEYNEEGKKLSATVTEPKKIIKLVFDDKGVEIGRTEYKKRKGQMGDISSSHENVYDENGRIQEETTVENEITIRKIYTYKDKKITSKTIFENEVKTLFIEYKNDIKIVHIFDGENEISVFEEAL
ncbi:MAG: hypothetical protein ACTTKH_07990 [Treponema sp.]